MLIAIVDVVVVVVVAVLIAVSSTVRRSTGFPCDRCRTSSSEVVLVAGVAGVVFAIVGEVVAEILVVAVLAVRRAAAGVGIRIVRHETGVMRISDAAVVAVLICVTKKRC